jgi:WD40 repeat protein
MEFATQQFVDNITSITPGALKGGLVAVDRQPGSDVLLIGGADGKPKTYNMYRTKDRVIGDDFNLVKTYAPMAGCVFAARFAPDGKRFVVGASDAGKGEVRVYSLDQEAPVWSLPTASAIYAATFRGDGALVAAGGFDGEVVLLDAASGQVVRRFAAAPTNPPAATPPSGTNP